MMRKEFDIYDEVAIIFRRTVSDVNNKVVLVPIKILNGYYNEEYEVFIDLENNAYFHYSLNMPGNAYGFRQNVYDFMKGFNTNDYIKAKRKLFNTIRNFEYSIAVDKDNNLYLLGRNEEDNKIAYLGGDVDLEDYILDSDNNFTRKDDKKDDKINAKYLADEIKKSIIGQDAAIDKLVTSIWVNLQSNIKDNMIIIGPTGVGKTAIIREMGKKLNRYVYKVSAAGLSQEGYVGGSVSEIIENLLIACNYDVDIASNAIVILDEFDKLAFSKGGQIGTESIQNELLTMLEDDNYPVTINKLTKEKILFSTKNITFIGLGNFYGINKDEYKSIGFGKDIKSEKDKNITHDDLIKYGFIPDLIGRMPVIITLNNLSCEDYIRILKNENNSVLRDRINILEHYGIKVNISDAGYKKMADMAISNNIGARSLNSIVNNTLSDIFTHLSQEDINFNYIEIDENTVINPKNYSKKLIKTNNKRYK